MELDEQLAALAAGELDDDTARALRARAAADPAIARRLARHQQLQQALAAWDAPAMSEAAVARLEDRVDEALAALDDAPLADGRVVGLPPRPLADPSDADGATGGAAATGDGQVVDLGEARRRRGVPSWLPGAAVAAALVAVVGTGIVIGGLPGGADLDTIAGDSPEEVTDAPQDESAELESSDTDAADDAGAADDTGAMAEDATTSAARAEAQRYDGVALEEGQLLLLADGEADQFVEPQGGDGEQTRGAAAESCVGVALDRDTAPADGREVRLLADGTYDGNPAAFVVVRTPSEPDDLVRVLAYDPDDCSLLAADETTR